MAFSEIRRVTRTPEEIQARKEAHEDALYEREQQEQRAKSKAAETKASWAKICDEPAIQSLIDYVNAQRNGLVEISVAGGGLSPDGKSKVMISNEERLSNLDRAAGIDIVIAYLERNAK